MKERCEKFKPEWHSNLDLCSAGAVLYQFSFQANRELVTMWAYDKAVDRGYRMCVLQNEI